MSSRRASRTVAKSAHILKVSALALTLLLLQGCAAMVVGAAVGTVATVAVETAKVPFKVTGAAIDAVTDDEQDE